jgi:hypothetical protein
MTAKREFPSLPQWLIAGKMAGIPSRMRQFGRGATDLAIDFRQARRPELITSLLRCCSEAEDGGDVDLDIFLAMPGMYHGEHQG